MRQVTFTPSITTLAAEIVQRSDLASADPERPLLDANVLARACSGMALVVVLTPESSWKMTERFGKTLSVYEGAARVYLPGFTEDANPFGGHELLLSRSFATPADATSALTKLRWLAAKGSVRRLHLGTDVFSFVPYRVKELEEKQRQLGLAGASDEEQLSAAKERMRLLQEQLAEKTRYGKVKDETKKKQTPSQCTAKRWPETRDDNSLEATAEGGSPPHRATRLRGPRLCHTDFLGGACAAACGRGFLFLKNKKPTPIFLDIPFFVCYFYD